MILRFFFSKPFQKKIVVWWMIIWGWYCLWTKIRLTSWGKGSPSHYLYIQTVVGLGISEPSTVLKWNWQNPWSFAFSPAFTDLSESSSRRSLGVSLQALAAPEPLGQREAKNMQKNTQKWLGKEAIYDRVIDWLNVQKFEKKTLLV